MHRHLSVGKALRRFRRLNGIKQSRISEMLNVSQGSVSRWESGAHEPDDQVRDRIIDMIAAHPSNDSDTALKRLVLNASVPVHLVCDATHRLLAASPSRAATWQVAASQLLGQSLWRFASPEIVAAEQSLEARGWFERPYQQLRFNTGANGDPICPVRPAEMIWETVPLADGRIGRLATTLD